MGTKIAFLGAGAIGGVMGGSLSRAGHDITLIDTWPAHIEKIQTDGTVSFTHLRAHEPLR